MTSTRRPNSLLHLTAARLRMLLTVKGCVWAAARDGWRYCDTRLRFVLLNVKRKDDSVLVSSHLSSRCGGVTGNGGVSSTQPALEA